MSEHNDQEFVLLEGINMDVEEDIAGTLSDFVELSHRCQWVKAQQIYDEHLEAHVDWFPIAAEYADFLLRQGKYRTLLAFCRRSMDYSGNKEKSLRLENLSIQVITSSPSPPSPPPYTNPEATLSALFKSLCELHLDMESETLDWEIYFPPPSQLPSWGQTETTLHCFEVVLELFVTYIAMNLPTIRSLPIEDLGYRYWLLHGFLLNNHKYWEAGRIVQHLAELSVLPGKWISRLGTGMTEISYVVLSHAKDNPNVEGAACIAWSATIQHCVAVEVTKHPIRQLSWSEEIHEALIQLFEMHATGGGLWRELMEMRRGGGLRRVYIRASKTICKALESTLGQPLEVNSVFDFDLERVPIGAQVQLAKIYQQVRGLVKSRPVSERLAKIQDFLSAAQNKETLLSANTLLCIVSQRHEDDVNYTILQGLYMYHTDDFLVAMHGVQDGFGQSLLMHALQNGLYRVARLLTGAGCDSSSSDWFGLKPIHYCAKQENTGMADLVLDSGSDVNALGEGTGLRPMHIAVWAENMAFIDLIKRARARRESRTLWGLTPYDYTANHHHSDIRDMLRPQGMFQSRESGLPAHASLKYQKQYGSSSHSIGTSTLKGGVSRSYASRSSSYNQDIFF